jgi:hypothetical protein
MYFYPGDSIVALLDRVCAHGICSVSFADLAGVLVWIAASVRAVRVRNEHHTEGSKGHSIQCP